MAKCTETCPKCGADFDKVITESDSSSRYWDCFSYERTFHDTTEFFNQSLRCENRCLKQQLAAANAEIERLRKTKTDLESCRAHLAVERDAVEKLSATVKRQARALSADAFGPDGARIGLLEAEWEECRKFHLPRIAELERLLAEAQRRESDIMGVINDINELRGREGDCVTIPCDNPEADTVERQSCVEVNGDHTGYEPQLFYGVTWKDAINKAANASRRYYFEENNP